jgi:hypothetical protein
MFRFLFGLWFLFGGFHANVSAQEKFEKESRLNKNDVPQNALRFINSLQLQPKIKWYKEEALSRESIEAKFKLHKTTYSIEFDTAGNIEDIEKEVAFNSIDTRQQNSIARQLQHDCVKYKILKIQRQYTGAEKALLHFMNSSPDAEPLTIKYEIVVRCKGEKEVAQYEYLFNNTGEVAAKNRMVFKNSSHLEY